MAPWDDLGGPWEQQDGIKMVVYKILFDFELILGPVYISFLTSRSLQFHFCVFPNYFSRFPNRNVATFGTSKLSFSQKLFLMDFGFDFYCSLQALEAVFLIF